MILTNFPVMILRNSPVIVITIFFAVSSEILLFTTIDWLCCSFFVNFSLMWNLVVVLGESVAVETSIARVYAILKWILSYGVMLYSLLIPSNLLKIHLIQSNLNSISLKIFHYMFGIYNMFYFTVISSDLLFILRVRSKVKCVMYSKYNG